MGSRISTTAIKHAGKPNGQNAATLDHWYAVFRHKSNMLANNRRSLPR